MGRGPGWTDTETATLFRMVARNADYREIAAATGRSVASCKNKLSHPSRHPQGSVEIAAAIRLRQVKRPSWTAETEADLIRMCDVEDLSWFIIDSHFGRMHGTCRKKYNHLKQTTAAAANPDPTAPKVINPRWTDADMVLAETRWRELFVNVYGEGAEHAQRHRVCEIIGTDLQRTATAIASRLRTHGASFGLYAASKPLAERRDENISQAMIEARARRDAEDRRSITASFFGDPPPGYSALDQRRQPCTGAPRDSR